MDYDDATGRKGPTPYELIHNIYQHHLATFVYLHVVWCLYCCNFCGRVYPSTFLLLEWWSIPMPAKIVVRSLWQQQAADGNHINSSSSKWRWFWCHYVNHAKQYCSKGPVSLQACYQPWAWLPQWLDLPVQKILVTHWALVNPLKVLCNCRCIKGVHGCM